MKNETDYYIGFLSVQEEQKETTTYIFYPDAYFYQTKRNYERQKRI